MGRPVAGVVLAEEGPVAALRLERVQALLAAERALVESVAALRVLQMRQGALEREARQEVPQHGQAVRASTPVPATWAQAPQTPPAVPVVRRASVKAQEACSEVELQQP